MEKLASLPIDWANVSWDYVFALVLLVFVCSFLGTALSLKRTFLGCFLTTLFFGTAFMFWTYYPHNLPLPTLGKPDAAAAARSAQQPGPSGNLLRDPTYR
jgi:hypothetical protein